MSATTTGKAGAMGEAGAARRGRARRLTAAPRAMLVALTLLGFFLAGAALQLCLQLGLLRGRTAGRPTAAAERLPRLFCRVLLRVVGVVVELRGVPPREGAALLAANHVSWIDIPALAGVLPFCFLAKAEVGSWPLLSALAALHGTVFVDRRRRRSILPANRAIAACLAGGRGVLFFPEGTTLAEPLPGRFLSSHFAAAGLLADAGGVALVQPVAILYSSPAAAWVGDDTLVGHLWRTLRAPPLQVRISFGEPIPVRRGDSRKTVAAAARAAVAALLVEMGAQVPPQVPPLPGDPTNGPLAGPPARLY